MENPKSIMSIVGNIHPTWGVVSLLVVFATYHLLRIGSRDPRMPKGPPTVPILGNFHQIPSSGLYAK